MLTLAKSQKVDLKKLQLGILAEQFLNYLRDQRFKFKLEFAGDYLVMASWLTLLKSQLIIPEDENKEDDVDFVVALRIRKQVNIKCEQPNTRNNLCTKPTSPISHGPSHLYCAFDNLA